MKKANPQSSQTGQQPTELPVNQLLNRIQRLQQQTGGREANYEELRQQYEQQANQDVKRLQLEACQHRTQSLLNQADINTHWRFDAIDMTDPSMLEPLQIAYAFINGFELWEKQGGRCVLIHGDYGTGKSTLAGAIAHELIENHQRSVIFQQWESIINRLFFGLIEDPAERNRYRKALEQVDLLILDEIAANRSRLNESQANFLGHLLRRRNNLGKSVILITNHHPDSLHQAVGDFCYEAIRGFTPVCIPMHGCSRRPDIG